MSISRQSNNREGFIIVISLILMLVMMTMGVGLYYSSKQSSEQVGINVTKSDAFYAAESCITEAKIWLEKNGSSSAPCKNVAAGNVCHTINSTKMSKWQLSAESQTFKNRTKSQNYKCSISLLGKVSYEEGGKGTGFDIGESDSYVGAKTKTKYLYRIGSSGFIGNFKSEVEVIASMIF
jgi:type IV pilus assembly protein PilX|tara:strand:+ start:57 stop:593 length:537 start_codon:yes stop_codon:yes gene_type:complete